MIYPHFLRFRTKIISMIFSTVLTLFIISPQSHLTAAKPTNTFVELTKNPYFVDKTELLGAIMEPRRNIFIASPDGFFKTSNLQMIRSFLQLEFDINNKPKNFTDTDTFTFFRPFEIAKEPQNVLQNHMANYSVLFMDLKYNISQITRSIKDVETLLDTKLRKAYQEYDDVLIKLPQPLGEFNLTEGEITFMENLRFNRSSENQYEIIYGLQNLCSILYKYFRRPVFILIDDYDYAANEIVSKRYDFVNTESSVHYFYVILNEMLCRALKDDREFESYAIVTGLNGYIAYADRFIRKNPYFLNRNYSQTLALYFSFTEKEVDGLLARYQCQKRQVENVKKYYKGHLEGTYNPYSIIRYLESKSSTDREGKLEQYWAQSKSKEFIEQALKSTSFRQKIQSLVDDRSAVVNLTILPSNENEYAALDILYRKATEMDVFKGAWQFDDEYLFRYLREIGYFYSESSSSTRNLYRILNEEVNEALRDLLAIVEVPKNETSRIGNNSVELMTLLPDDFSNNP